MRKGSYKHGKYIVGSDSETADFLTDWIVAVRFKEYEREEFRISHGKSRRRNKLYSFRPPPMRQDLVMKVSRISPDYKLSRRIDLFLTGLYKNYSKVSFHGARALHERRLPVAEPLAFWTYKESFLVKRSYFLCRRLPGVSVSNLLSDPTTKYSAADCRGLAEKLIKMIRGVHAAGLRHGDFKTDNVQIDRPRLVSESSENPLSDGRVFLLDYDNVSKTRIKLPWLKKIYDLKDISRLSIPAVGYEELLDMYFDGHASPRWRRTFIFWKKRNFKRNKRPVPSSWGAPSAGKKAAPPPSPGE